MSEPTLNTDYVWQVVRAGLEQAQSSGAESYRRGMLDSESARRNLDLYADNVVAALRAASPAVPAPTPERVICRKCGQDRALKFSTCPPCAYDVAPALPASAPTPDTARLDWLEAWVKSNETDGHLFCFAGDDLQDGGDIVLEVEGQHIAQKPTLREALDAARLPIAPLPESVPRQKEVAEVVSGSAGASPAPTREGEFKDVREAWRRVRSFLYEGELPPENAVRCLTDELNKFTRARDLENIYRLQRIALALGIRDDRSGPEDFERKILAAIAERLAAGYRDGAVTEPPTDEQIERATSAYDRTWREIDAANVGRPIKVSPKRECIKAALTAALVSGAEGEKA